MWWLDPDLRRRFARDAYGVARLLTTYTLDDGFEYRMFLPVEDVGAPQVCVRFEKRASFEPSVTTSPWSQLDPRWNPGHLPHRNPDGSLCLWFPLDPRDQRWEWDDGLTELLAHTAAHLMRERLWLRTGRWHGPERPHGLPEDWDAPARYIA